jgi:hypothetical protein
MLRRNVQGDAQTVLLTHQWADTGCCGWRKYTPGNGNCNTPSNCPPLVPAKYYHNRSSGYWASTRYLGPIKQVKVFADGSPRVVYWPGNEQLKGDPIPLPPPHPLAVFNGDGAAAAIKMYGRALDLSASLVVEATLSCVDTSTRAGFIITGSNFSNAFVFDCATQRLSIGPIDPVAAAAAAPRSFNCGLADGPQEQPAGIYDGHHLCETFDRNLTFPAAAPVHLRLLLRSSADAFSGMAEFYANDVLSHPYSIILGFGKRRRVVQACQSFSS